MADNSFSKNFNFELLGQSISQGFSQGASEQQYMSKQFTLDQKIKANRENFKNAIAQRNEQVANSLNSLKFSEVRRGVVGGTSGTAKQVEKKAESLTAQERLDMLTTERNLGIAKKMERVAQKNRRTAGLISLGTTAFSAYNAYGAGGGE